MIDFIDNTPLGYLLGGCCVLLSAIAVGVHIIIYFARRSHGHRLRDLKAATDRKRGIW